MFTIHCSCPAGRPARAVSGLGPPGRDIQRGACSESPGGKAQEGSGTLDARRGGHLGTVLGSGGQLLLVHSGCASPSIHCPLQLLLASGSRQEGGHGGTSPFWHSSEFTCTRPGSQSRERTAQVSRAGTRRPRDKPWGSTVGGSSKPASLYLCHLGKAASCRAPSHGKAQDMEHHHSWVGGPHSSSGDSGGRLHRRHCRAPRAPTLPMPQPL